jgi:hypothetical protein
MKICNTDTFGHIVRGNANGVECTAEIIFSTIRSHALGCSWVPIWWLITLEFENVGASNDGTDWSDFGLIRRVSVAVTSEPTTTDGLEIIQLDREILGKIKDLEDDMYRAQDAYDQAHDHDHDERS